MALLAKVGSFIKKSDTTGTQSITGIGFKPKVVFFFGNEKTTDGAQTDAQVFFGASNDAVSEPGNDAFLIWGDNLATSKGSAGLAVVRMEMGTDEDGTLLSEGTFSTMDDDGFTINWNRQDSKARVVCYLALGGDDITNSNTFSTTVGTSTGSYSRTGLGFQPTFLMLWNTSSQSSDNSIGAKDVWGGFGAASSTTERAYMAFFGEHNVAGADADTARVLKPDKIFGQITTSQRLECDLTSFDADGYTFNWGTHDAYAAYYQAVAMAGGRYKVGTFQQPTSTGEQTISGLGFKPKGIIFFSAQSTSNSAIQAGMQNMFGFADYLGNCESVWWGASDQVNPTVADSYLDRTKAIKFMTEGTPALVAEAKIVEMGVDYFTLDWTTADANARYIGYIAFGEDAEDTDWADPTAYQNNAGAVSDPANGIGDDNAYATFTGATGVVEYVDFGFAIPPNATIVGIEIEVKAKATSPSGFPNFSADLSWDDGSSFTSVGYDTDTLTTSEGTYILGGPTDLWGRTWSPTEFNDGSFAVEITGFASSSTSVDLDSVRAKIYYVLDHIAVGNVSEATAALTNELTFAHTVVSQQNRVLIVTAQGWSGRSVTGVTYNGISLDSVRAESNEYGFNSTWILVNPPEGEHNVVVSYSGNNYSTAGAVDFYNAEQNEPIGATNALEQNSTHPSATITTLFDKSFVVDNVFKRGSPTLTPGDGQTEIEQLITTGLTGAASYEYKESPGSVTMSWSSTGGAEWESIMVEVKTFIGFIETTQTVVAKAKIIKPLIETLTEDFNDGSLDTYKWTKSTEGADDVVIENKRAKLKIVNDEAYRSIRSNLRYNLTGSYLILEVLNAPTLSDGSVRVALEMPGSTDYNLLGVSFIIYNSNQLRVWARHSGGTNSFGPNTVNLSINRFLRIRESSGTIYYDYSPNGTDWTNFYSHSGASYNVTDMQFVISAYNADVETNVWFEFDNINLLPTFRTTTAKARIVCISPTVLVSPPNFESEVQSPVYLTWVIPETCDGANIHAHVQVDQTDNTFGDLEKNLFSFKDSSFEFWDGDSWETYPTNGVSSDYSGNQARVQVSLSEGTKYWRVRGGRA